MLIIKKRVKKHENILNSKVNINWIFQFHFFNTFKYLEKKTKDIKIPKLAPFKDELLQQAVVAKKQVCLENKNSVEITFV